MLEKASIPGAVVRLIAMKPGINRLAPTVKLALAEKHISIDLLYVAKGAPGPLPIGVDEPLFLCNDQIKNNIKLLNWNMYA